jgi:hypothetical protein
MEKRLQVAREYNTDIPSVIIYTASGKLLCRIKAGFDYIHATLSNL